MKIKKYILVLVCGLCFMQAADAIVIPFNFDTETGSHFSKWETIKTWLAEKHHKNKKLKEHIQLQVGLCVPQNTFSKKFARPVRNDKKNKQYFGGTFPTIADIELPFLQYVHDISASNKIIKTIEFAAARGFVSWKVPYTFQNTNSMHYANELSKGMIKKEFTTTIKKYVKKELRKQIKAITGSCFNIFNAKNIESELKGQTHAIYAQNLEHFFNPVDHQKFLGLIAQLLVPKGRAFLCTHSPVSEDLYKKYKDEEKKQDDKRAYPGFLKYNVETHNFPGDMHKKVYSDGLHPKYNQIKPPKNNNEPTGCGQIGEDVDVICKNKKFIKRNFHTVSNYFTPETYRRAVELHNKTAKKSEQLKVVEAFYLDILGKRTSKWSKDTMHTAAIIEKKSDDKEVELQQIELSDEHYIKATIYNNNLIDLDIKNIIDTTPDTTPANTIIFGNTKDKI